MTFRPHRTLEAAADDVKRAAEHATPEAALDDVPSGVVKRGAGDGDVTVAKRGASYELTGLPG